MKTSTHSAFTRVVGLVTATLLCSMPGLMPAQDSPPAPPAEPPDANAGQTMDDKAAANLSGKFATFAGSEENARALVSGLRSGSTITLTTTAADGQITTTAFQPATGELGHGNAAISLALAQESLSQAGITQPTPAQIEAALNGGTLTRSDGTTATLNGVLTLRAAGQGWGDIAKTLGVKLGPAMQQLHTGNPRTERPDRPTMTERPDRAVRGAEVPARPVNTHRPDRVGPPNPVRNPMPPPPHPIHPGKR